ncbi:MAG: DivIVA domain-containing protein [Oscillospiraceae bacterium]|nr:DivIVA domain-containing protein [Oscillospiraceae bacterium]
MITPQDIREKKFEKATFGGYDMALVDDFLERLGEDYEALYKENAILKSKLKVLVEKVEEYRSTEDSMRMALLTAQKMGNEIVDEAKAKAAAIMTEVDTQAHARATELKKHITVEEARLAEAERKTAIFSSQVLDLIAEEARFIKQLKELKVSLPAVESAPVAAPPVADPARPKQVAPPAVAAAPTPDTVSLDQMEASVGAYLAQEVGKMTEDISTPPTAPPDPFDEAPSAVAEVDFLKMFDQDPAKPAPDARAEEKFDIAQSISSALGGTEELKADTDAFYDDEGQPTTTRPKFDFEDLQFGVNFPDDAGE